MTKFLIFFYFNIFNQWEKLKQTIFQFNITVKSNDTNHSIVKKIFSMYLLKRDDSGALFWEDRVVFFFAEEAFFFFDGETFEEEEPLRVRLLGERKEDLRFRFLVSYSWSESDCPKIKHFQYKQKQDSSFLIWNTNNFHSIFVKYVFYFLYLLTCYQIVCWHKMIFVHQKK